MGDDDEKFELVDILTLTPFQSFAAHFHQDYNLFFSTFREGVETYVRKLTDGEKALLKLGLGNVLDRYRTLEEFRAMWLSAGANWAAPGTDIRAECQRLLGEL